MKLVMKFGGTSMGDAQRIRGCADLVRQSAGEHQVVAVVSAMNGVTDQLIELADAAAAGHRAAKLLLLGKLRARHEEAAAVLGGRDEIDRLLSELESLVTGIVAVGELTPRSRDAVISFGERLSVRLIAAALNCRGMTGGEIGLTTDAQFGEAEPLMELSLYQVRTTLGPLLSLGRPIAVTGFVAATQHGVLTTLGRGGSDYTATLIGAALPADEVWIWSDVDGLLSANPRVVPTARLLDTISFAEALELGQFGAKSLHPRALEPAAEHRIPVRFRNTFNPACPGTLICESGSPTDAPARAVLSVADAAMLTVSGAAMIGRPGTAARVFAALAEAGVNILMISQSVSEAGISLIVTGGQLEKARAALESRLLRTGAARHVQVEPAASVVALVGAGMRGTPGVAARVFAAVARRGVNVLAIAQGSSELSICFVVHRDRGTEAVQALHEEFRLGG